jgi:hypothetical protein
MFWNSRSAARAINVTPGLRFIYHSAYKTHGRMRRQGTWPVAGSAQTVARGSPEATPVTPCPMTALGSRKAVREHRFQILFSAKETRGSVVCAATGCGVGATARTESQCHACGWALVTPCLASFRLPCQDYLCLEVGFTVRSSQSPLLAWDCSLCFCRSVVFIALLRFSVGVWCHSGLAEPVAFLRVDAFSFGTEDRRLAGIAGFGYGRCVTES